MKYLKKLSFDQQWSMISENNNTNAWFNYTISTSDKQLF